MKKIICFLVAVMLIASMAVTAHAVTPALKVPTLPVIPDISNSIKIELPDNFWDNFWDNWFAKHPIKFLWG